MNRFFKLASRIVASGVVVLGINALAGCSVTPHLDEHRGEAVAAAIKNQTANPKAPVAGTRVLLDAESAVSAVDSYHEAAKNPPADSGDVYNIGVGSDSSN